MNEDSSLNILIEEFNKLPGIGSKTAQRLSFYILEMEKKEVERFAKALVEVKEKIKKCEVCGNLTDSTLCEICSDEIREENIICVVEEVRDLLAMEKSSIFKGKYHVLHGKISPLEGKSVNDLNIKTLIQRIGNGGVKEVILALNPDLEGETTSLYIKKILKPLGVKVTRIASGIPLGGNIEFADIATLAKSIENRSEIKE